MKRKKKHNGSQKKHIPYGPYEAVFKRPVDLAVSTAALVLLSPVMVVTALLVKILLGSPVIFKQARTGLNGIPFMMYKFRTMTDRRDQTGELLADSMRITGFGKLLRATSLDELPELINIIRGDMSLAGPRPLLPEYLEYYSVRQKHRHDVRPGLTGLAQVNGRNSLSWEEKFAWDLQYVRKITFSGDMRIILKTLMAVLKRKGITPDFSETVEAFRGDRSMAACHIRDSVERSTR